MNYFRYGLAVLAAPLIAPFLLWLLLLLVNGFNAPGNILVATVIGICSYMGLIALGLPCVFILRKIEKLTRLNLTLTGFLAAATAGQILPSILLGRPEFDISLELFALVCFGIFGAVTALFFSLIAGIPKNQKTPS